MGCFSERGIFSLHAAFPRFSSYRLFAPDNDGFSYRGPLNVALNVVNRGLTVTDLCQGKLTHRCSSASFCSERVVGTPDRRQLSCSR